MAWYSSGFDRWKYRYRATVDRTKVGADIADFPTPIKITTTEWPALANAVLQHSFRFTTNGSASVTHPDQVSAAVRSGTKIFFVWQESDNKIYAGTLDTATRQITDTFYLAETAAGDTGLHCYPNIAIDSSGYLYVVWGYGSVDIKMRQSTNVNSTAAWAAVETIIASQTAAYPKLLIDQADTLHLTYRQLTAAPSPKQGYMQRPAAGSWSAETVLIDFSALSDTCYVTCFALGREASGQKSLHLIGCRYDYTASLDNDLVYMKSLDGGATWKKADGTSYTLPATNATIEHLYTGSDIIRSMRVIVGADGNAHVVYTRAAGMFHVGWSGSTWVEALLDDNVGRCDIQYTGSTLYVLASTAWSSTDLYVYTSADGGATWAGPSVEATFNAQFPVFSNTYNAADAAWMFQVYNGVNYDGYIVSGVPGSYASRHTVDGQDILFTNSAGTKIPHRIDSFDGTTLCVRGKATHDVDADADFYGYCGCATCEDQQDNANVWAATDKVMLGMRDGATTASILDLTPNAANGTKKGAGEPVEATGVFGKGQTFDGSDDYVNIADAAWQDPGGTFTVCCAFKTSATMDQKALVMHDNSAYKWLLYFTTSSGSLQFYVVTASATNYCTTGAMGTDYYGGGVWHTVVGVYDKSLSTKRLKLYVDGVEAASATGYNEDVTAGDEGIDIGRWLNVTQLYFTGTIDEVRVCSDAKPATWVTTWHNSTIKALIGESGGFWKANGNGETNTAPYAIVCGGRG